MGNPHNKPLRIVASILLAFNIVAVLSLLCSYAARYIDPRDAWIFALFGLLYPWLLVINSGFVVLWLILWKKYALISLVTILAGWQQLNAMIATSGEKSVLYPGPNFTLITWNIHGFAGYGSTSGNVQSEISEYLGAEIADIICLQEFRIRESNPNSILHKIAYILGLPNYYAGDYYQTGKQGGLSGIVTFSRFHVLSKGMLQNEQDRCFGIFTDLVINLDTVRIINVHLASVRLGQKDIEFYYHLKNTDTENVNLKAGLFSILKKLKLAFILRAAQTDKLTETINNSPHPVIVCGDMNDSPFSFTYRRLTGKLKDAYQEEGNGFFGSTYDGALPNYRIDYILCDSNFNIYSYNTSAVRFSDHYPVSALILVNSK